MSRAPAYLVAGALAVSVVAAPLTARAQLTLNVEVRPRQVEVGSRFLVQMRTNVSGDQIGTPTLKPPAGISGTGPQIGQQAQVSFVNGQVTQSVVLSATWSLVAAKPGTYKLGPITVETGKGVVKSRVVTVEVVPQGSLPAPLAGQPALDPFDLLRGMGGPGFPGFPGFPSLGDDEPESPQLPELPEDYKVERPLDPIAFLRVRAVPRKVVVGQQVTLGVYAYGSRGGFNTGMTTDPSRNDFLAINLMEDTRDSPHPFELDGKVWVATKVTELALFPLKAGKLRAGEMTASFVGRGYSRDQGGLERKAQPLDIRVVEPPLEDRPPGYRIGDVGTDYRLSVQVEPREIPAGGSISVVAKLKGIGNLPYSLLLPEQNGVRFLEPQLVDQIAPQRGVVQGFRTFTYVVELSEPGERDLGEITLPYWDPEAKAYAIARASLGKIKVTGTVKPQAPASALSEGAARLKGLITPPPQLRLDGTKAAREWPAQRGYWLLLIGLPLTATLAFVLTDLARRMKTKMAARSGSLATALNEALAQLAQAASANDAAGAASAAERALFLAIEKGTGIKGRGVLKAQLSRTLSEAKVESPTAEQAAELLDRCDELRFAGEAADLTTFAADVRAACKKLGGK